MVPFLGKTGVGASKWICCGAELLWKLLPAPRGLYLIFLLPPVSLPLPLVSYHGLAPGARPHHCPDTLRSPKWQTVCKWKARLKDELRVSGTVPVSGTAGELCPASTCREAPRVGCGARRKGWRVRVSGTCFAFLCFASCRIVVNKVLHFPGEAVAWVLPQAPPLCEDSVAGSLRPRDILQLDFGKLKARSAI